MLFRSFKILYLFVFAILFFVIQVTGYLKLRTFFSFEKRTTKILDIKTQIFCNVEINLKNIEAVGFDLDNTLAKVLFLFISQF